jgi:hypothetical protein
MSERQILAFRDKLIIQSLASREASPRKARLFACACYRSAWQTLERRIIDHEQVAKAIEIAERMADRSFCGEERNALVQWAKGHRSHHPGNGAAALQIVFNLVDEDIDRVVGTSMWYGLIFGLNLVPGSKSAHQCRLLRDIFGNPTQRVSFHSVWLTDAVLGLARMAYEDRALPNGNLDGDRLAVLATVTDLLSLQLPWKTPTALRGKSCPISALRQSTFAGAG